MRSTQAFSEEKFIKSIEIFFKLVAVRFEAIQFTLFEEICFGIYLILRQ